MPVENGVYRVLTGDEIEDGDMLDAHEYRAAADEIRRLKVLVQKRQDATERQVLISRKLRRTGENNGSQLLVPLSGAQLAWQDCERDEGAEGADHSADVDEGRAENDRLRRELERIRDAAAAALVCPRCGNTGVVAEIIESGGWREQPCPNGCKKPVAQWSNSTPYVTDKDGSQSPQYGEDE